VARKKILYAPNLTYHVVSRCIELRNMLQPDEIKEMLEEALRRTLKKYTFELSHYVIMGTHFHFYIRTVEGGAPIYRIMQYVKSRFAEAYNRKMYRTGPFWNERYSCIITETIKRPVLHCFRTIFYMGYNPVKAGMVDNPRHYRFSSYNTYVDPEYVPKVPITPHPYYMMLGDSSEERIKHFLWFERCYQHAKRSKSNFNKGSDPKGAKRQYALLSAKC
jgi:putative transposase